MTQTIIAGVAKTIITPPPGIDLGGYGGREGPATGVHDDLEGAALCFQDETTGAGVILLTADLIGIDAGMAGEIRECLAAHTQTRREHVMVTCTHTHAGPAMPCLPTLGRYDAHYLESLKNKLTTVAAEAWDRRRPARVSAGRAPVTLSWNRRTNDRNPVQHEVEVLRVDDLQGAPVAVWICYPAHPVTLREDNLLVSADWVGAARKETAQRLPGAIVLFAQGCAGNLVSRPHDGDYATVAQQGRTFARAVLTARQHATPTMKVTVAGNAQTVALGLEAPPPLEEARAQLAACRRECKAKWEGANYGERQLLAGNVDWATRVLKEAEVEGPNQVTDYEVQALRIGDFAVVGLNGEVFVEYALRLRRESPFSWTAVAGYSNGAIGYVPTAAAFAEGGYEVNTAVRYYGTLRLRPECEATILRAARSLLAGLQD